MLQRGKSEETPLQVSCLYTRHTRYVIYGTHALHWTWLSLIILDMQWYPWFYIQHGAHDLHIVDEEQDSFKHFTQEGPKIKI